MKYDVNKDFEMYKEVESLKQADIFHLYDTGHECAKDNSGYHDSRLFNLIGFNTKTMERADLGKHDGINSKDMLEGIPVAMFRVYADGSFFIRFSRLVSISLFQCVSIE